MYGFAVMRAASGMLTPGEVIAFALYFENISAGISEISNGYGLLKITPTFCRKYFDFLDIPDENTRVLFPPKSGMTTNMSLNSDTFGSNIPTAKNMC